MQSSFSSKLRLLQQVIKLYNKVCDRMVEIAKDGATARLRSLKESLPSSAKIERWGNHAAEDGDMNRHTLMAAILRSGWYDASFDKHLL